VVLTWVTGAPVNDDIAGAEVIAGSSGVVSGNTLGAGVAPDEPPMHITIANTVWYQWDAPASGTATFELSGLSFSGFFLVYAGDTPDSLSLVADSLLNGTATFTVAAGGRYYVQVGGDAANQGGPMTLTWSLLEFTPTPEDTPTATPPPPSPSATPRRCTGDCNGNHTVSALEIFNVTFRSVHCMGAPDTSCGSLAPCTDGDGDGDGTITALEIFRGTQNSINPAIRGECGE
jgi:hypothetical protein